jgi:hypothetical protein
MWLRIRSSSSLPWSREKTTNSFNSWGTITFLWRGPNQWSHNFGFLFQTLQVHLLPWSRLPWMSFYMPPVSHPDFQIRHGRFLYKSACRALQFTKFSLYVTHFYIVVHNNFIIFSEATVSLLRPVQSGTNLHLHVATYVHVTRTTMSRVERPYFHVRLFPLQ